MLLDWRVPTLVIPPMYCDNCGAENAETAKFCRKCGDLTSVERGHEIETRVAARVDKAAPSDEHSEATVFSISPEASAEVEAPHLRQNLAVSALSAPQL